MSDIAAAHKKFTVDTIELKKAASVYRAVYHPLRLQIIEFIHKAERVNVTSIIKKFKLEQSLISAQLKILRDAKLVVAERQGKQIFYSVNYQQLNRIYELTGKLIPMAKEKIEVEEARSTKRTRTGHVNFTSRELKVMRLVCQQNTTEEIAQKLGLSKRTVEDYRANVLKKVKAKNSVGILAYAIKNGLFKI